MKSKAHIRYKLANGTPCPGVTTITGGELGWNTRVLIAWANRIGLQGIEAAKYTDDKAAIGTLAHAMVTDTLQKKMTDTADYSKNQIDAAENSALSFWEWAKGKKIEPILIEVPQVSEKFKYGGTIDIYAKVDGVKELIDLKTGKGIYDEMIIQVAGGYKFLLEENGHEVKNVRILNIPRAESESFVMKIVDNGKVDIARQIFLNCLSNYGLHKQIKKEV